MKKGTAGWLSIYLSCGSIAKCSVPCRLQLRIIYPNSSKTLHVYRRIHPRGANSKQTVKNCFFFNISRFLEYCNYSSQLITEYIIYHVASLGMIFYELCQISYSTSDMKLHQHQEGNVSVVCHCLNYKLCSYNNKSIFLKGPKSHSYQILTLTLSSLYILEHSSTLNA